MEERKWFESGFKQAGGVGKRERERCRWKWHLGDEKEGRLLGARTGVFNYHQTVSEDPVIEHY